MKKMASQQSPRCLWGCVLKSSFHVVFMSLAFGIGAFQMRSSYSWVHFLNVDHLGHREQLLLFLERGPKPNCPRPRLALGLSLLPPHPLSPKTPLFVMENYTFTNCVSFLTPSIFPHRDRFWNDLMDESCRYPAVYRNCLQTKDFGVSYIKVPSLSASYPWGMAYP